jgi:hypothetical protein
MTTPWWTSIEWIEKKYSKLTLQIKPLEWELAMERVRRRTLLVRSLGYRLYGISQENIQDKIKFGITGFSQTLDG